MTIISDLMKRFDQSKLNKYLSDNDVKIIGGAEGPTAIYVSKKRNTLAIGFALGTIFGLIIAILAMAKHMNGNSNG